MRKDFYGILSLTSFGLATIGNILRCIQIFLFSDLWLSLFLEDQLFLQVIISLLLDLDLIEQIVSSNPYSKSPRGTLLSARPPDPFYWLEPGNLEGGEAI